MFRLIFFLGLAVLTCLVGYTLSYYKALDFFAVILVLIAGVYIGFGIEDGRRDKLILESIVAIGFVALVLLGMWKWPILIPAGYFLHGVWDLLHHPVKLGARVKKWYPPACIAYDWLVGAYIYIYMF
jgi:hypothetical protein